jgi:hypothetical protein
LLERVAVCGPFRALANGSPRPRHEALLGNDAAWREPRPAETARYFTKILADGDGEKRFALSSIAHRRSRKTARPCLNARLAPGMNSSSTYCSEGK